jgi:hypothetical protein
MNATLKLAAIGLVCAVPFGLAIRDEMTGGDARAVQAAPLFDDERADDDHDDDERGLELADPDEKPSPVEAALPAAAIDQLFGATAAAPGPLFEGIALGAASTDFLPEAARARLEAFRRAHGVEVDFDFDERELLGFRFSAPAAGALTAALTARWGPAVQDGSDAYWIGDRSRLVVTTVADRADLLWTRFQSVDELVTPSDRTRLGVEPFPVLGARLDKVAAALGSRLEESPDYADQYQWRSPGLPLADGDTVATIAVEDGMVAELVVETTGRHAEELAAAMIEELGPPASTEGNLYRWKGKRTVEARIEERDARIAIRR